MRRLLLAVVAVGAAAVVSGCTHASGPDAPSPSVITQTHTITRSPTVTPPPTTFTPAPPRTVAPLPPGAGPAAGEVEKRCPYIASSPDQNAKTNVADIDGSHVYRTTVLTRFRPVGCRFYFYAPPYEAITDIEPHRFATTVEAHNAMVLTGRAGLQPLGKPDIVPGVDAVLYQTRFFGPDGRRDWACVFAAGRTMVVVHTQRADTSLNALLIARAIAGKF